MQIPRFVTKRGFLFHDVGRVAHSSCVSQSKAASRDAPHISSDGVSPEQQAGRSGCPKMAHRFASVSWIQRTPAGFPFAMPGMGLVMEGAMQQAPQSGRQERAVLFMPLLDRIGAEDARTAGLAPAAYPAYHGARLVF